MNLNGVFLCDLEKESTRMLYNRTSQFDPIRRHRPYCPWVASDDGEAVPGWKLTLSAVVHHKKDSSLASLETSSTLLDDVIHFFFLSVN